MDENKLDLEHVLSYMLGGNAMLVVVSTDTGQAFRYRIEDTEQFWAVYNDMAGVVKPGDSFIGLILKSTPMEWKRAKRETILGKDISRNVKQELMNSAVAFGWCFRQLTNNSTNPELRKVDFYHMGRCSICNRPLKNPKSLKTGIGPECAKNTGL